MKQPDDIFSQMLPFWEHLTPQEQMALREASVPSTLPKGTITHRADRTARASCCFCPASFGPFFCPRKGGR